jgi:hypothetical protein
MEYNNETRLFVRLAAPACLFLMPLLLGIVVFRLVRDTLAGVQVDYFDRNLVFIVLFCLAGFLFALFFCKKELGWFQAKSKRRPEL